MFARLAAFNSRYWYLTLAIWLAAFLALHSVAPDWSKITHDGDFAYLPERMTSVRGNQLMAKAFPDQAAKSSIAVILYRNDRRLSDDDKTFTSKIAEDLAPKEGVHTPIAAVMSFNDEFLGKKMLSARRKDVKGQAALVVLQLNNEFMAVENVLFIESIYKRVEEFRHDPTLPAGLEIAVTGSAALGTDALRSMEESVRNTEFATAGLVVLILLIVYRAPGLVLVPLAAIGVSFVVAIDFIAFVVQTCEAHHIEYQVFKTTKIFIIVVLFGAATDYCLFLIARYREELQGGKSPRDALEESIRQTGHAITASAMTTILGLSVMVFASFGKYRSGGPTIALSLIVALLACLTVAPALLRACGTWVFWPFMQKRRDEQTAASSATPLAPTPVAMSRFWTFMANTILKYPGTIIATALVLLAFPAYVGMFSVPITYDMITELNPHKPSVEGTRVLEKFFSIGEAGPITVLAFHPDWDFNAIEQRTKINSLTRELANFEYVDSHGQIVHPVQQVRSLTNPLGDPPRQDYSAQHLAITYQPRCKETYVSPVNDLYHGKVTKLDLVCKYDPFSTEAMRLMTAIERHLVAQSQDPKSPWNGASFDFIGITPGIRDLNEVNTADTTLVAQLVTIAVLAVLIFLLRRPVISVYLIFTVLFGYFVSLGITKLVFAWFYGDSFQGLDWKLKLFLFVILVAVGEDYNIYLVTRVFEEQRKRGALPGLREAVIRTGGIITSCGVIMAGTFGSMTTGTLRGMIELGFAMSLGVLLDTFIIRTIMVPAFLALWARWSGETEPAKSAEPEVVRRDTSESRLALTMNMVRTPQAPH